MTPRTVRAFIVAALTLVAVALWPLAEAQADCSCDYPSPVRASDDACTTTSGPCAKDDTLCKEDERCCEVCSLLNCEVCDDTGEPDDDTTPATATPDSGGGCQVSPQGVRADAALVVLLAVAGTGLLTARLRRRRLGR